MEAGLGIVPNFMGTVMKMNQHRVQFPHTQWYSLGARRPHPPPFQPSQASTLPASIENYFLFHKKDKIEILRSGEFLYNES